MGDGVAHIWILPLQNQSVIGFYVDIWGPVLSLRLVRWYLLFVHRFVIAHQACPSLHINKFDMNNVNGNFVWKLWCWHTTKLVPYPWLPTTNLDQKIGDETKWSNNPHSPYKVKTIRSSIRLIIFDSNIHITSHTYRTSIMFYQFLQPINGELLDIFSFGETFNFIYLLNV